ncbi:8950_t:CDS:2 [Funneliformis caledonium]|uniref:8950_t:CDS:1 n=1 Tax=Funneliformis caledonium TaxID=1117310 RepID=A0A9N9AAJ1_9GLOM|nr:8950_t:CDS:2 [Funneliformis caledonium]
MSGLNNSPRFPVKHKPENKGKKSSLVAEQIQKQKGVIGPNVLMSEMRISDILRT